TSARGARCAQRTAPAGVERRSPLPERLEVADDRLQLRRVEARVGHLVAGLEVLRVATCVRSGPTKPRALVPRIAWHVEQELVRKRCSPAVAAFRAGDAGLACAASHRRKTPGGSAKT